MQRNRIVDLGRDAPLRQESPQLVPAQRADDILMKHMVRVLRRSWERDGSAGAAQCRLGKQTMVGRSARTTLLGAGRDIGTRDARPRGGDRYPAPGRAGASVQMAA